MFKTILVPTDKSQHAQKALEFACDLAKLYGSKLVMIHVLEQVRDTKALKRLGKGKPADESDMPDLMAGMASVGMNAESIQQMVDNVEKTIFVPARQMAADKGVGEIETLIKGGDAAKRILKCAKKVDADLIVIGSRGLGNIKGAFLGSVSDKVSRKAKGSCVTIRS
ncbi:MAG: universal stress protein [Rhodospirillales bacterium]|nr:universal stress protein [Rhodospirillales bacterium]